ncbi:hypothetical protein U8335_13805 [Roseiconus lacunae]|uniref:hypothetical protein n=1 Tax=Roseiconus lacunae TaxID=2605694 RepID=UPI003085471D|nr:hypothetical protein U8335_13805 [Stieleria sp. HD01]
MTKKISIQTRPKAIASPDQWVENRNDTRESAAPAVKPKRLTIDIAPDLHSRLKVHCAQNDIRIADLLRQQIIATVAPVSE